MVEEKEKGSRKKLLDYIGPGLGSALVTLGVSGVVYGAVALRDLVNLTAHDLTLTLQRVDDHEDRIREQEQRRPRLEPLAEQLRQRCESLAESVAECHKQSAVMHERVRHVEEEQAKDRLCARVKMCGR